MSTPPNPPAEPGAAETGARQPKPKGSKQRVYMEVSERLRESISKNEFPNGRLPTERVLGVRHDVSVGTIRKVLDLLETEGIITRRQGSGTYISQPGTLLSNSRRTHLLCYLSGTGTESHLGNFFNRLMMGVHSEVERAGYATVLAGTRDGKVPMPVQKRKVDGIVVAGTYQRRDRPGLFTLESIRENNEFITRVAEAGLPVVAISNPTDCQTVYRVNPDYDAVLHEVLSHLKSLGHHRVAVYGGPRNWPAFGQRIDAFLRQAALLGMDSGEHLVGTYERWSYQDPDAVVRTVRDHVRSGAGATAAIVISGRPLLVQLGVEAAGLKCPEQFSLVTFADLPRAELGAPTIDSDLEIPATMSAISVPVQEMAHAAIERLVALLDGKTFTSDQRNILVPLPYHRGQSVHRPVSSNA